MMHLPFLRPLLYLKRVEWTIFLWAAFAQSTFNYCSTCRH